MAQRLQVQRESIKQIEPDSFDDSMLKGELNDSILLPSGQEIFDEIEQEDDFLEELNDQLLSSSSEGSRKGDNEDNQGFLLDIQAHFQDQDTNADSNKNEESVNISGKQQTSMDQEEKQPEPKAVPEESQNEQ